MGPHGVLKTFNIDTRACLRRQMCTVHACCQPLCMLCRAHLYDQDLLTRPSEAALQVLTACVVQDMSLDQPTTMPLDFMPQGAMPPQTLIDPPANDDAETPAQGDARGLAPPQVEPAAPAALPADDHGMQAPAPPQPELPGQQPYWGLPLVVGATLHTAAVLGQWTPLQPVRPTPCMKASLCRGLSVCDVSLQVCVLVAAFPYDMAASRQSAIEMQLGMPACGCTPGKRAVGAVPVNVELLVSILVCLSLHTGMLLAHALDMRRPCVVTAAVPLDLLVPSPQSVHAPILRMRIAA